MVVGIIVLLVLVLLISAGRAGRAGAAPSLVAADGEVEDGDEPVKADTPPVVDAAAPALSHGFGGAALLVVAIAC